MSTTMPVQNAADAIQKRETNEVRNGGDGRILLRKLNSNAQALHPSSLQAAN